MKDDDDDDDDDDDGRSIDRVVKWEPEESVGKVDSHRR